jgi:hypothetical protein
VKDVHIVIGTIAGVACALATLAGAWSWWRSQASRVFWWLLRAGQGFVVIEAAFGGILLAIGEKISDLHLLYGLLPIAIGVIGEQFRVSSAQMVLDSRELPDAKAVGKLPQDEQRAIVTQIIRREIGVMTLAALVTVVLIARAATVH